MTHRPTASFRLPVLRVLSEGTPSRGCEISTTRSNVGAQYSDLTVEDLQIGQIVFTSAPLGVIVSGSSSPTRP